MTAFTPLPASIRCRTTLAALMASLLLAACGGGPDAREAAAENAVAVDVADDTTDRRFELWAPGSEASLLAEQTLHDPGGDGSMVQLIVQLNPAAVAAGDRALALGAAGSGESGDAAALRARALAAKVQAVATASRGVLERSVLQRAPGAVVRQQFSHAVEGFVLSVPWAQAAAVAADLARNPAVDSVEPDRLVSVDQASPGVRLLDARAWGVDRIDQRAPAFDGAFRQTLTGSGVSVYVVDTGVSPHREFGSRLAAGFSAINDGRGTLDCHGHGTHVAGTAAGATLGVAPGARVVPVRVMTCAGSSAGSSVLAGLDWVAAQGVRPAVVNLSLGGAASSAIDAATQRLMNLGFSVVAAAGNNNVDACTQSPGRAAGVVTVAASDKADVKAPYSNWGGCVALWAPGTAIASAGHASTGAVVTMNGTSMAAPHVAGAVALLLQEQPSLAPTQARQLLLARASGNRVTATPGSTTRHLLFAGLEGGSTVVPTPAPVPRASAVVVRSIEMATQVPAVGAWRTQATVKVVDNLEQPVAGAMVTGRFSNSSREVTCNTAATGLCTLASANALWATTPWLGVAITQVKTTTLAYTGGGTRSAQVTRPEAPVASVAAITGTLFRATPSAVNWTPQFTVTVKDDQGALVSGAKVQTLMQVHSGGQVAGQRALTCQTGATGQCRLDWNGARLDATHTGAALLVLDVQRNFLVYRAGALTGASVGRIR